MPVCARALAELAMFDALSTTVVVPERMHSSAPTVTIKAFSSRESRLAG